MKNVKEIVVAIGLFIFDLLIMLVARVLQYGGMVITVLSAFIFIFFKILAAIFQIPSVGFNPIVPFLVIGIVMWVSGFAIRIARE